MDPGRVRLGGISLQRRHSNIRDRVIQTAAKLVLEPIFEADFEDNAYG
jgi:retron-type reverse transcriptase